jgi:hypothetical protein
LFEMKDCPRTANANPGRQSVMEPGFSRCHDHITQTCQSPLRPHTEPQIESMT